MQRAITVTAESFSIERQCPQCGAPVSLEETDRIFMCPYCHVKHFLYTPGYFRYYLQPLHNIGTDVLYVPYWRFKGLKITIHANTTKHDIIDRSYCAVVQSGIPLTLGFRTQTLKMKFVEPETPGIFFPPAVLLQVFLKTLEKSSGMPRLLPEQGKLLMQKSIITCLADAMAIPDISVPKDQEIVRTLFIGEVVSCIYTPFFVRDATLYDGITGQALAPASSFKEGPRTASFSFGKDVVPAGKDDRSDVSPGKTHFLPALCPVCGWDLQGEKESCMMACPQCRCFWEPSEGKLRSVEMSVCFTVPKADVWIPFWRLETDCTAAKLASVADFYRLAAVPRPILPAHEHQSFYFWAPAFKSNFGLFFLLNKMFTMQQGEIEKPSVAPAPIHPVTLPASEALQSFPAFVAEMAPARVKIIPFVKSAEFSMKRSSLVLVPFVDKGMEYFQPSCNLAINKNALRVGRSLG